MDKRFMLEQLAQRIRDSARVAQREHDAAASEARDGATPDEKRSDARVALEFSNLARAQGRRATAALDDLAVIEAFRPGRAGAKVALGDILEIEDGDEGRTLFLAPVGAGIELTMPEGDGFVTVVTPASPLGKAVLGRGVGDTVEVVVKGEAREWTVTFMA
ncbi:MAG TPA: GreA/GreB family elongation factor [Polyangiaceae bacterium]|nr:GreA/GreB family elongation factor [Polyangiaceae bacterium]